MTYYVVTPDDARAARNLEHVAATLDGYPTVRVSLESISMDRDSTTELRRFEHTPKPLLDAWIAHRRLTRLAGPGDTVLISDWRGLGGMFALAQWSTPPESRRTVLTVASDSAYLEFMDLAGTVDGLPMPIASQVDWEIVQYRWSSGVIGSSELAANLVRDLGVEAGATIHEAEEARQFTGGSRVWAPEPVGRRSRTGDILRAVSGIPDVSVVVSEEDEDDGVWSGTSWEALRHARAVLGDRILRAGSPADVDVAVLGDPFSIPEQVVADAVAGGLPIVVPTASAAAARWPGASTWSDVDQLATILRGTGVQPPGLNGSPWSGRQRVPDKSRAARTSVGVPVFRDVRFLEECVTSILGQELDPFQLIIVDDGSDSEEVDEALVRVKGLDPRISTIRSEHRGVCVARNRIMDEMTGDSFLLVDSDDELEPDFLFKCAEVLRSDDRVLAVSTWTRFFGAYEGVEAKPPFDGRVGSRENPIISTAALVDMKVRDAGIRFAPDLAFLYCEDWHFWSQIVESGGSFGLVPEPLIRHRVHGSSGGFMRTDLAYAIGKSRATRPLRP